MPTMNHLAHLHAFLEAARLGSLSAAARHLDLSPAAVSKSVMRLEADLGVRLFNRSTRRLVLTPEGERFRSRADAAVRELTDAMAEASRQAGEAAGRVRLSAGASFGRRWVQPCLPALLARHPQLSIELSLDNRPVDLVAEGIDIAIRGSVIEDSSLIARRVCALPVVLVASPAYLRRAGLPERWRDLAGHECIGVRLDGGAVVPWYFKERGERVAFAPGSRLSVSDPEAVVDLALAGAGIVQTGLPHVVEALKRGRLRLLLGGQHHPGEREIVLHYPHREHLAPRVRVVVDHVLAHLKEATELHVSPRQFETSA